MRLTQLPLPPRLNAFHVEYGSDGIDIASLISMVVLQQKKHSIALADIPIEAPGYQRFVRGTAEIREVIPCTRYAHAQVIRTRKPATSQTSRHIARNGVGRSGCVVIEIEDLLVKGIGSGVCPKAFSDVGQGCGLELRTWNLYKHWDWENNRHAFGIGEEKQFLFLDRSSQRGCPLIGVDERPRTAKLLIEVFVGIEDATVPEVFGVPMELAATRLGDETDIGTGKPTELTRVSIANDGGFLDLVLPQQQIERPGRGIIKAHGVLRHAV